MSVAVDDARIIDRFFVDVFNDILALEERWIRRKGLEDLSITEMHMLIAISERENAPMSTVAQHASLSNGTVTTMVKKLERKGYVERHQDGVDKRIVRVGLSKKGDDARAVHDAFHARLADEVLESLDDSEKECFLKAVHQVTHFFHHLEIKEDAHD